MGTISTTDPNAPFVPPDPGFTGVPPPDDYAAVPPDGWTATSYVGSSGTNRIDALLYHVKWGAGGGGTGASLDYSFPGNVVVWHMPYGHDEPITGYRPLSAIQQSAARKALGLLADVANIQFREVADTANDVGDIRFGNSTSLASRAAAWAYYPNPYPEAGDVWFNANYNYNSDADGTYSLFVNLHELGHAIGLKHPHEGLPVLPPYEDYVGNTVMSYNGRSGFLPSTPMLYDIAALQYIYGANMSTRAGDSVYRWAPGEQIFETIWDAGGRDTIDWSNQASAAYINLAAGAWSELGPANAFGARTLAIAYNCLIENANGGPGDDRLFGNAAANALNGNGGADFIGGNAGDDAINGGTGDDTLYGDSGNDTIYGKASGISQGAATDADTIFGGTGNDLIYGAGGDKDTWDGDDVLHGDDGNDRIFGSFGNDAMYGGIGADELGGQAGNDTMYGGAGNDKLGGGTGNDLLYGDADADVLAGREGLDRLTGGTGNDVFDYDAVTDSRPGAANRDVILDFVGVGAAVGDRIDLATIDANTTRAGDQAFVFRGTAAFTGAGQVRVLASGADTLIQANTGGTLAPELEILVKDGTALHSQWVAGDFIL